MARSRTAARSVRHGRASPGRPADVAAPAPSVACRGSERASVDAAGAGRVARSASVGSRCRPAAAGRRPHRRADRRSASCCSRREPRLLRARLGAADVDVVFSIVGLIAGEGTPGAARAAGGGERTRRAGQHPRAAGREQRRLSSRPSSSPSGRRRRTAAACGARCSRATGEDDSAAGAARAGHRDRAGPRAPGAGARGPAARRVPDHARRRRPRRHGARLERGVVAGTAALTLVLVRRCTTRSAPRSSGGEDTVRGAALTAVVTRLLGGLRGLPQLGNIEQRFGGDTVGLW